MPQQLALLLFIVFALYLFRMDSKHYPNVSPALWVPVIWMIFIGSRPFALWMDPQLNETAASYLAGDPVSRNIYTALIVVGLIILSRRKIYWAQVFKNNSWIFLFFLYCGISVLWSDFPSVSFKRWVKVSGHLVMVLIILTESNPAENIKTVFSRCYYVLVPLSIVLIRYYPQFGREFRRWSMSFIGVAYGKNGLGFLSMIGSLFFFWNLHTIWRQKNVSFDKGKCILFLLMSLWLLYKANSATSLVCFISGVCILIGLELPVFKKKPQHIGYVIFFILFCSSLVMMFNYKILLHSLLEATDHSSTFWGRVELWKDLISDRVVNPLVGTGFESFWLGRRVTNIWADYVWHPNQAHNGYVETYLHLGQIGLFLLIGAMVSAYKKILKTLPFDFDYGKFRMACLVIVLLFNITEAAFKGLHLIFFIFILTSIDGRHPTQIQTKGN